MLFDHSVNEITVSLIGKLLDEFMASGLSYTVLNYFIADSLRGLKFNASKAARKVLPDPADAVISALVAPIARTRLSSFNALRCI